MDRYYELLGLDCSIHLNKQSHTIASIRKKQKSQRAPAIHQKAKRFRFFLDEIKKLIDISAEGIPSCRSPKVMVKQHFDDLNRRIQQMIAFRQELASRY